MDGWNMLAKVLFDIVTPAVGTLIAACASGWMERRKLARGGHLN